MIDVHGAWTRRWATVDGSEPFESQQVVWLQAGSAYADVRSPFHPAAGERCFTGRSGWDGGGYRWTHRFDLEPGSPAADDVGALTWDGDLLIEEGMFPTASGPLPYVEAWTRLPGGEGAFAAFEGEDGCMVRVGDHAIAVVDGRPRGDGFGAAYRRRDQTGWTTVFTIGDAGTVAETPRAGWALVAEGSA